MINSIKLYKIDTLGLIRSCGRRRICTARDSSCAAIGPKSYRRRPQIPYSILHGKGEGGGHHRWACLSCGPLRRVSGVFRSAMEPVHYVRVCSGEASPQRCTRSWTRHVAPPVRRVEREGYITQGGMREHTRPMIRTGSPPAFPACSATAGGAASTRERPGARRALAASCERARHRYCLHPLASPRPQSALAGGGHCSVANEEQTGHEDAEQATEVCGVCRGRGCRPHRRWGQCQRGGRVVRPRRAAEQSGRSRCGVSRAKAVGCRRTSNR